jgi:hypothetical protein
MIATTVVTRLPAGRPLRRARVGVALTFLVTGLVFGTWAARLPAIKHALELSEGGLGVAFMGLNAGAVLGLQLGGALVPRSGSRAALRLALPPTSSPWPARPWPATWPPSPSGCSSWPPSTAWSTWP